MEPAPPGEGVPALATRRLLRLRIGGTEAKNVVVIQTQQEVNPAVAEAVLSIKNHHCVLRHRVFCSRVHSVSLQSADLPVAAVKSVRGGSAEEDGRKRFASPVQAQFGSRRKGRCVQRWVHAGHRDLVNRVLNCGQGRTRNNLTAYDQMGVEIAEQSLHERVFIICFATPRPGSGFEPYCRGAVGPHCAFASSYADSCAEGHRGAAESPSTAW